MPKDMFASLDEDQDPIIEQKNTSYQKKQVVDMFANLDDTEKQKETLTQKADKVVVPAIEKSKPFLQRIAEILNPPLEETKKKLEEQGFKVNEGKIKKKIYGAGTKALEVANAPSYAVTNTLYQSLVNKDYNAAKSLWNGLTLKERKSIGDILVKKFGVPSTTTGKLIQGGLGFIGDIITDPTAYLGIGMAKNTGATRKLIPKASSKYAEELARDEFKLINKIKNVPIAERVLTADIPFVGKKEIPYSGKVITPVYKGIKSIHLLTKQKLLPEVFDTLGVSFSRDYRPSTVDPITWNKFTKAVEKAESYENLIKEDAKTAAIKIKQAFKKEGITDEQINDIIQNIERESDRTPLTTGESIARTETQKLGEIYKDIGPTGKKLIQEEGYTYLPHIKEDLPERKQVGMSGRIYTTKTPSDLNRNYLQIDTDGTKQTVNMSNGKVYENGKVVNKLSKDELNYISKKRSDSEYLFFNDDKLFKDSVKFSFPDTIDNRMNYVEVNPPSLNGRLFTPEMAKIINQRYDDLIDTKKKFDKINISQGTIPEINKDVGVNLFSKDVPKLVYIQGLRVGKAAGSDKLFKEVRNLGEIEEVGKKKGYVQTKAPELEGAYYPPEIARRIDEVYNDTIKITEDPVVGKEFVDKVTNSIGAINNEWKILATIVTLPFHSSNIVSSMWQNMNRGLEPFDKAYISGARLARSFAKREKPSGILGKYYDEMRENNVIKTGFLSPDIDKSIDSEIMTYFELLKKNKNLPKNIYEMSKKAGGDIGGAIESFVRSSLYVKKRTDGLSPEDAARFVRDTHFDYSDLTKGEKEIRKFIPFYTWNKKNMALQFRNLMDDPAKATRIIKLKNNVEAMVGQDDYEQIHDEPFLKQFPIYIGEKDGKRRYVMLNRFVPNLATNQASEPLNWLVRNYNPVIAGLSSLLTNIDIPGSIAFGRARNIKEPGRTGEFMGQIIPRELEFGIRMIRPLMELERVSGTRIDTPQKKDLWMQLIFGKNIKEFDERDLIRWFNVRTEKEAMNLKIELKNLRKQLQIHPEKEKVIMYKYNKLLDQMMQSKIETAEKKMQAFKNI